MLEPADDAVGNLASASPGRAEYVGACVVEPGDQLWSAARFGVSASLRPSFRHGRLPCRHRRGGPRTRWEVAGRIPGAPNRRHRPQRASSCRWLRLGSRARSRRRSHRTPGKSDPRTASDDARYRSP